MNLFGHPAKRVYTTAGAEQEYFLIDRDTYNKRKDLIYTGRTLFGAKPPKGQEMDDHYFGSIRIRVSAYMKELNEELWKLGVLSKTEHNEVAPAQHEIAPIFSTANVACDHNQIMMEIMRKVAKRHSLTCLLHEKPFAGVNGSGKHNNWSISTDKGTNLLDPGSTPEENAQFLTFFCAVIKAVDSYPELLRISVATAANDHRLGANEAPPAVVSIFIGDELDSILSAIETGTRYDKCDKGNIEIGVDTLPSFPKDMTDRNRTSPFAFTGNRFEFRMPGSSMSIASANTMLNTIVADSLRQFADELEGAEDFSSALNDLIKRTIKEHRRVIFNGNGYDEKWLEEAEKRGLPNLRSSADAIPHLLDEKNVEVLTRIGIFTKTELYSRFEIMLENYCKTIRIDALTMLEMARVDILPAVFDYEKKLAATINAKKAASASVPAGAETDLLGKVAALADEFYAGIAQLDSAVNVAGNGWGDTRKLSMYFLENVIPAMSALRSTGDRLEVLVGADYWPFPSYGTILYRV